MTDDWLDCFPQLRALEEGSLSLLKRSAHEVVLPTGAVAFASGQGCEAFLFLTAGTVRVQLTGEGGREILLYRVTSGETCVLTTSALLANENYMAEGIAETPVRAITLPAAAFRQLIADSAPFREFVFSTFGERITALVQVIQDVAFAHIAPRLAAALIARSSGGGEIELTHQELAVELGTAREVVSRQLKGFEQRGWVGLGRGRIRIADRDALENLARAGPG
ncbi:MAG: Crp/Fnr family transcriptional regulator [Alphaproteobacteria bacterium]|nr:Crp/Fnr family transcriptional regulator [Alphaproteobacteria bacterium]